MNLTIPEIIDMEQSQSLKENTIEPNFIKLTGYETSKKMVFNAHDIKRIGRWSDHTRIVFSDGFTAYAKETLEQIFDMLQGRKEQPPPQPITDVTLQQIGFESQEWNNNSDFFTLETPHMDFTYLLHSGDFFVDQGDYSTIEIPDIQYIHEIQNIVLHMARVKLPIDYDECPF